VSSNCAVDFCLATAGSSRNVYLRERLWCAAPGVNVASALKATDARRTSTTASVNRVGRRTRHASMESTRTHAGVHRDGESL